MKSLNRNKAGDNVWNAMKHTTHLGISTKCWNPLECLFIYLMFYKIKKCDKIYFSLSLSFLNISKKKVMRKSYYAISNPLIPRNHPLSNGLSV